MQMYSSPPSSLRLLFVVSPVSRSHSRPCPASSSFLCPRVAIFRAARPRRRTRAPVPTEMRRRDRGQVSTEKFTESVASLVRRGTTWWERADTAERAAAGALALAAVSVSAVAVNVLVNVSLALAFVLVPFALAPFLLTIFASVTAFAFLTFATVGAGLFFVSTPVIAVALLAKTLLPIVIAAAAMAVVARSVLKRKADATEGQGRTGGDDGAMGREAESQTRDPFEEFDDMLRQRGGPGTGRSWNVSAWSLSEVVDELDVTGLGEYRQLFIDERIDGRTLLALSDEDIRSELASMPLGDRKRLSRLIADLRSRSK